MNNTKIIKTNPKKQNNKNKIIKIHIDLNREHYLQLNDNNEEEEEEIKCIKTIIVFK